MRSLILVPLALLAGCANDDAPPCFGCSINNQPGTSLGEGGEMRHEHARVFGSEQTWIQLYQFTGPPTSANAPFPAAALGGQGPLGDCVDERDPASATWPYKPIVGATYLDLPMASLTGTGITNALSITKTDPPNKVGNSTYRGYDFTYGGGEPGTAMPGFNGTLTADESMAGGHYTLDTGENLPRDYYLPPAYSPPLDIGTADTVSIPTSVDLDMTWDAPANDFGANGAHTKKTYYAYTAFFDPTAAFAPQFLCFPDADGHQTIPTAVLAALPQAGIVIHAETTHYMDAATNPGSDEIRRFDLIGSLVNISHYELQ